MCGTDIPGTPAQPQPPPTQLVTVGGGASNAFADAGVCWDVGLMLSDAGTCPDGYQQVSIWCCALCDGTCPADDAGVAAADARSEAASDAPHDAAPDVVDDRMTDARVATDGGNGSD